MESVTLKFKDASGKSHNLIATKVKPTTTRTTTMRTTRVGRR